MHRSTRAALTIAAVSLLTLGASVSAQAAPAIPVNNGQETTGAKGGAHGFFTYEIDGRSVLLHGRASRADGARESPRTSTSRREKTRAAS